MGKHLECKMILVYAVSAKTIEAIGFGLPGQIDYKLGMVKNLPNIPGWINIPLGKLIEDELYVIGNIDATIIAQRPKLAPYREQMMQNVADALHISRNQVNIKATTEEGLGFTGSGEGISAQAICVLLPVSNYQYVDVLQEDNGCSACAGCKKIAEMEKGLDK